MSRTNRIYSTWGGYLVGTRGMEDWRVKMAQILNYNVPGTLIELWNCGRNVRNGLIWMRGAVECGIYGDDGEPDRCSEVLREDS